MAMVILMMRTQLFHSIASSEKTLNQTFTLIKLVIKRNRIHLNNKSEIQFQLVRLYVARGNISCTETLTKDRQLFPDSFITDHYVHMVFFTI